MTRLTFSPVRRFLLLLNVDFALAARGRHEAVGVERLKLAGSSRGDEALTFIPRFGVRRGI